MEQLTDSLVMPLLHDYEKVPQEYVRQVANIKRVLECWVADPEFEAAFSADPAAALASLGLNVTPEEILPLVDEEQAIRFNQALQAQDISGYPVSVLRYRAFILEKTAHRERTRLESRPVEPRIGIWRDRQVRRCANELGGAKSDAIVHPFVAYELSKGCTVGCWFCGVQAPKFDHNWHYTPENAALWQEVLEVTQEMLGASMRTGFLYWATDPLDNPDYERFLADFSAVAGRCPQTTTALGVKDVERTRKLLQHTRPLNAQIDRFSVLSLKMLRTIHESFTPEELIKVECIPQNREAKKRFLKSTAGRARTYAVKKAEELTKGNNGDTIACVTGFLFNMPDREVKLITPCQSNEKWPLGYWVVAKARFDTAAELKELLTNMVATHMKTRLGLNDRVALRRDLEWDATDSSFCLRSRHLAVTFPQQPHPTTLLRLLAAGTHTLEEVARLRTEQDGVAMEDTFFLLDDLFQNGFLDEEPELLPESLIQLTYV